MIGEIFDKVYNLGSLTGEPLPDVQTISVPPGGAAAVDMKLEVPGDYLLVDHALSRAMRGLVGTTRCNRAGAARTVPRRALTSEELSYLAQ